MGRYTHRVGISNQRLVSMDDDNVTFRTKEGKTVTLSHDAFLGRFLQHVLPKGFVKIRHDGRMASGNATTRLEIARDRLVSARACDAPKDVATNDALASHEDVGGRPVFELGCCPVCGANAVIRRPLVHEQPRAPPVAA